MLGRIRSGNSVYNIVTTVDTIAATMEAAIVEEYFGRKKATDIAESKRNNATIVKCNRQEG